ncbi:hypothetical protein HDU96_006727 [Phlyctochytrium bullatum]|nr:hypothetical protein HDU96_006727 [Phlyctochytrium bullatum]
MHSYEQPTASTQAKTRGKKTVSPPPTKRPSEMAVLRQALEDISAVLAQKTEAFDTLEADNVRIKAKLSTSLATAEKLANENTVLKVEKSKIHASLSLSRQQLADFRKNLAEKTVAVNSLESENTRIKAQLSNSRKTADRLVKENTSLKAENSEILASLASLAEKVNAADTLKADLSKIRSAADYLATKNSSLEADMADLRATAGSLAARNASLEADMADLRATADSLASEKSSLEARNANILAMASYTQQKFETFRFYLDQGNAALERLGSEMINLRIERRRSVQYINELEAERQNLFMIIAEGNDRARTLTQERDQLAAAARDHRRAFATELASRMRAFTVERIIAVLEGNPSDRLEVASNSDSDRTAIGYNYESWENLEDFDRDDSDSERENDIENLIEEDGVDVEAGSVSSDHHSVASDLSESSFWSALETIENDPFIGDHAIGEAILPSVPTSDDAGPGISNHAPAIASGILAISRTHISAVNIILEMAAVQGIALEEITTLRNSIDQLDRDVAAAAVESGTHITNFNRVLLPLHENNGIATDEVEAEGENDTDAAMIVTQV